MASYASVRDDHAQHPVQIHVMPVLDHRDRLTTAFRPILAIPHLLLVGGPMAGALTWARHSNYGWGSGGMLGAVAAVCSLIGWFAIVFTGSQPRGLADLAAFYLRWRVRASAYMALLQDDYPPFTDDGYPVQLTVAAAREPRDRMSIAFRIILVIPHLLAIWVIGFAWACVTIVAWFAILATGRFPASLYEFSVGALRWTTRVEAYLLLLDDAYPPFSFHP